MSSRPMPDQQTINAFVLASHFKIDEVKSMLAERPELLELPSSDDELPIEAASHVGNLAIIEVLKEAGAHVPLCTKAVLRQSEEVLSAIDADADAIETRGAHGMSLLFHAVVGGDEALCRALLERGAKPSTVSEGASQDPLHATVFHNEPALARLLVEKGASPDAPNYQGKTPRQLAEEFERVEILELFGGV